MQAVNDAAERRWGRSRRRVCGHPLVELGLEGDALAPLCRRVLESGAPAMTRTEWGELRASPWWQGGECVGVVVLGPLVPDGAQSGWGADLATLAAGLAHEVKNPLAALRGAAELLSAELSAGQPGSPEYVALMMREVGRIDALLTRLLLLGRPTSPHPEPLAPAQLLHELALQARALAADRGVPAAVEELYDPALPELVVDAPLLVQALLNLVKNAVEALPPAGGKLTLEAFVEGTLRLKAQDGRSRALVRLSVRDNGPGLGPNVDRLFTPFFTTKASGTGLGLLLARRAVEAHGGRLSLHDAPPGGTEARILLPLAGSKGV